ncbi:hypothetical protein ADUPG1_008746 [Aduncisulcus paluster]|uniref:Uncharacterized protein n=1 Tax=Aduncisulcus paluster TaxID=2918883 RepID=A0ABQ5KT32_9EUKA|nr:hypothetical protein ADUPG1_008746 [Aduncisulcus paluster]
MYSPAKDTLFALPVGNRAIRLNLTDGKDDVKKHPSSIIVYIGFASNLLCFTLPPIDELRSIADPSVSIVLYCCDATGITATYR